jgi:hypothetical protein
MTEEAPSVHSDEYYRGFYDGFAAAKKAQDYPKIYPTQPLGPTKTMDIQWPDRLPTTSPIPPRMMYDSCLFCGLRSNEVTGYVCYHPNCPTKVTC